MAAIFGVRYAWTHGVTANLYNLDGLPTFPFRTDKLKFTLQKLVEQSRAGD